MTIQILILSILLFGTTGMVIDSGRVYQIHSKMQSFADQVAQSAAAELDGEGDALARACRVQTGLAGNGGALIRDVESSGHRFRIRRLYFYDRFEGVAPGRGADTQPDISHNSAFLLRADGSTDLCAAAADPAQAAALETLSAQARFVAAEIDAVTLSSFAGAMYQLAVGFGQVLGLVPQAGPSAAVINTIAVATLRREICVDASTLVMCNPWEGRSPTYEAERDADNLEGRTLMAFANAAGTPGPGATSATPFAWEVRNQIFELVDPVTESPACTPAGLAAAFPGVPAEVARPACLMAQRPQRMCFQETVEVRPAAGATVVAALNAAFDLPNYPFEPGVSYDPAARVSGRPAGSFLEPDLEVGTAWEDMRFDTGDPAASYQGLTNPEGRSIYYDFLDYQEQGYTGLPAPGTTLNANFDEGYDWGFHACHLNSQKLALGKLASGECGVEFLSDTAGADRVDIENMFTGLYDPEAGETGGAETPFGGENPFGDSIFGGDDPFGGGGTACLAAASVPNAVTTWYGYYRWARANAACLAAEDGTSLADVSMTYAAVYDPGDPPRARTGEPIVNAAASTDAVHASPRASTGSLVRPRGYAAAMAGQTVTAPSGASATCDPAAPESCLSDPAAERRRHRSLMVNCQAAVAGGLTEAGTYEAEVVAPVDWFLPRPAMMFCGYLNPASPADEGILNAIAAQGGDISEPWSRLDCTNVSGLDEVRVFLELIEEGEALERFTPLLTQ